METGATTLIFTLINWTMLATIAIGAAYIGYLLFCHFRN